MSANVFNSTQMNYSIFNNSNISESVKESSDAGGPEPLTEWAKVLVVISYSLVSLLAMGGNSVVIFIIFYFRTMRTPTNLLIANLALADLLMAIFCIPFSYWTVLLLSYWPFGLVLCKLIHFSQAVFVYLSAYSLVAIAIDRFIAIMYPMRPDLKITKTKAMWIIAITWFIALLIASPLLVVMTFLEIPHNETLNETIYYQCQEVWSSKQLLKTFNYSVFILQYIFPLIVLVVTYSGIGIKIWRSRVPGGEELTADSKISKNHHNRDSVKKMVPMMVLVTSLYAICWFPQNMLINVFLALYPVIETFKYIYYIWWACHITAMLHTTVNPIIYCRRSDKFREGFKFVFRWLPGIKFMGVDHRKGRPTIMTSTFAVANSVAAPPSSKVPLMHAHNGNKAHDDHDET